MTGQDIIDFIKTYELENASVEFDGMPPEFDVRKETKDGLKLYSYVLCQDGEICISEWRQNEKHPTWHTWVELESEYMEVHDAE